MAASLGEDRVLRYDQRVEISVWGSTGLVGCLFWNFLGGMVSVVVVLVVPVMRGSCFSTPSSKEC